MGRNVVKVVAASSLSAPGSTAVTDTIPIMGSGGIIPMLGIGGRRRDDGFGSEVGSSSTPRRGVANESTEMSASEFAASF